MDLLLLLISLLHKLLLLPLLQLQLLLLLPQLWNLVSVPHTSAVSAIPAVANAPVASSNVAPSIDAPHVAVNLPPHIHAHPFPLSPAHHTDLS